MSGLRTYGLVGFTPTFSSNGSGQLLMTSLVKSGVLQRAMFSLWLGTTKEQSKIFFGGWDDKYVKLQYTSQELVNKTLDSMVKWLTLQSKTYWQVKLTAAHVGNEAITLAYNFAVFDSGSSLTYLPSKDYS